MLAQFEQFYWTIKSNRWYWLFSIYCRVSLAFAFLVAGWVKIIGERFASGLAVQHPMGAYLEALHHTGYYYTFIGVAQIVAAILLLIPRTVTLGALLYFPIIVNIWLLSYAVRFEGSYVTAPLMVCACLFLIVWNYDRVRYLLPLNHFSDLGIFQKPHKYGWRFPYLFAGFVLLVMVATVVYAEFGHEVMPRNSLADCKKQFTDAPNQEAGYQFCECIHTAANDLDSCLETYEEAVKR